VDDIDVPFVHESCEKLREARIERATHRGGYVREA
jgi:hypothetical protein